MVAAGVRCLALVPALVRRYIVGEALNPVSMNPTEEAEVSDVVCLHQPGTRTVLPDHAPAHLSGVGIAYHPDGGPRVTSVVGLGMGAGAEATPGATRCAPVARAHALPLGLVPAPPPTLLTRGIAGADLAQGLPAAEGGVTVEMISGIAGPDLQYKKQFYILWYLSLQL
jgi:hypothetical protein